MDFEDIGDAFDRGSFVSYARTRAAEQEERDAVVGDIVHFWNGENCRAAIVVATGDLAGDPETLHVFQPGERDGEALAVHDETRTENTYHWPEAQ
jgi:hypothetical protein